MSVVTALSPVSSGSLPLVWSGFLGGGNECAKGRCQRPRTADASQDQHAHTLVKR